MLSFLIPHKVSSAVRTEQIRLLYHQGSTIQFLGIISALISVSVFWQVADHGILLIWLSWMILLSLLRLYATFRFCHQKMSDTQTIERWGKLYVLGTFVAGLTWGGLAFLYEPSWPATYQVILFVIYTGIVAGSFNTNTPLFIAFPAFYLPPVICLMFVMLQQRGEGFTQLSALFGIYIVLMYVSAVKFHNRLAKSLQRRLDNEQLTQQLVEANNQLLELAEVDELTKLYNRRSMDRYLTTEWNRHYRNQKPLSLLFIDIDYFKQYNDSRGHEGGDECLIKVAQVLKQSALRSTDMAARFGGEEFAIILPETAVQDAEKIARKITDDLTALNISHPSSMAARYVTVSIGVITLVPDEPDNPKHLRTLADKALYKAKAEGRNRVVIGQP